MVCFLIIVNAWKPLAIFAKHSNLAVPAPLDPPLIYEKQFGEYAIVLLVNHLYQSSDESRFTLRIFFDLSRAFDRMDHKIITKKLQF